MEVKYLVRLEFAGPALNLHFASLKREAPIET